jgi:excisionase family DNA binding protein
MSVADSPLPTTPDRGMTVPELAKRLRLGRDRVRALIRSGEIAAIDTAPTRCGRPRWLVMPEALAAWERSRQVTPPPPGPRPRKRTAMVDYYP